MLVLREYFVWLIRTNQRVATATNLEIEGSLSSILAVKLDRPESVSSCLDYDPDDKLLQAAAVNYEKRVTGQSSKEQ